MSDGNLQVRATRCIVLRLSAVVNSLVAATDIILEVPYQFPETWALTITRDMRTHETLHAPLEFSSNPHTSILCVCICMRVYVCI